MKYFPLILFSLIIFLGGEVLVSFAQSYTPLAPLPGTITSAGTTNMSTYISGAIKLIIALGAALAVLYAVIGGTKYVAASINPSAKSDAKDQITNAFVGLAIILTSYLLLNSINPTLKDVSFELKPVVPKALEVFDATQPYKDVMTAASCPEGIQCTACVSCSPIPASIPNKGCGGKQCFVETNLLEKIKKIPTSLAGWRITESWPPTINHMSICHQNGGCADLNNTNGTEPIYIKTYYNAFKAVGLDVLYESNNCAPYIAVGVTNCKTYETMTNGSSFHVK